MEDCEVRGGVIGGWVGRRSPNSSSEHAVVVQEEATNGEWFLLPS